MEQVLFTFGSVTKAQRAVALLSGQGIRCGIFRAPLQLGQSGCAYAVYIAKKQLKKGLELLLAEKLLPRGIYEKTEAGYREVAV